MRYQDYVTTLQAFQFSESTASNVDFDALFHAQDQLIDQLVEQGVSIAGWKIVTSAAVIVISPIFDFQLLQTKEESISHAELKGTELEVCFALDVPRTAEQLDLEMSQLEPRVAIELIRPQINASNHPCCDLYFHYGVLMSSDSISGEVNYRIKAEEHDQAPVYDFAFVADQEAIEQKRDILKKGVLECIRRGYADKPYFFITGTLNGLVPVESALGLNEVSCQGKPLIRFDIT